MKYNILIVILFVSILINACTPSQDQSAASSIQDTQLHDDHDEDKEDEPKRLDSSFYAESFFTTYHQKERLAIREEAFELSIPFDLHDRGGLTPDCYVTNLKLTFSNKAPFKFPQKLTFEETESGCVDKEFNLKGEFILAEDNPEFVQYHSLEPSRLLLLYKNYRAGNLAYYFTDGDWQGIYGKNIENTLKMFSSEELEDYYPVRSSLLMQVK